NDDRRRAPSPTVFPYTTLFRSEIHGGVYIGSRCTIGSAILERDVTIGSNVDVLSGRRQHGFARAGVPVQNQAGRYERVRIGRNRSEEHTSELQSRFDLVCRLLL